MLPFGLAFVSSRLPRCFTLKRPPKKRNQLYPNPVAINEAVKAANGAEGFTGDDSRVGAQLQTRSMTMVTNATAEDFNLLSAFRSFARDDFLRSVEMAKSFTAEAPRATATLAIARSVLENSPSDLQTPPVQ